MPQPEGKKRPIQQSVRVDCSIEDAFRLFTERFTDWWPLALYSMNEDDAETCAIEPWTGGRVFERSWSGEEHDWGSVTRWDPPNGLSFTWDPSGAGDSRQTVEVNFRVDARGTQVTLVHTGWAAPRIAVCTMAMAA
jgi:uncharacterized protein YndB with AHSA1/START domain